MNTDKNLEKLQKVFDLLETDKASTEEVAEAFAMVFEVLSKIKEEMKSEMSQMDSGMKAKHQKMMSEMESMMANMEESMKKGDMKAIKECERCMARMEEMKKDMKEIKEEIPTMPDLMPLEKRIKDVENREMPKIPTDLVNKQELLAEVEALKEELKKEIAEVRALPRGSGGGTSAMAVARAFKYIFHTETPVGAINGVNTTYTVKNPIFAISCFMLNGEVIALSNYTVANRTITFSSALPAAYSGKDFEIKYIG